MPVEAPAKPGGPNPEKPDEKAEKAKIPGPPDEDFWEKYTHRLEFPLSSVGAVLIHVLAAAILIFGFLGIWANRDDRAAVPIKLVAIGIDDDGAGSVGSGGDPEPIWA